MLRYYTSIEKMILDIKKKIIMIVLIVFLLLTNTIPLVSSVTTLSLGDIDQYAIIIQGNSCDEGEEDSYYKSFTKDVQDYYDTFHSYYNFQDNNIYVLFTEQQDKTPHSSFNPGIVDEESTENNLEWACNEIKSKMDDNDILVVAVIAHGNYNGENSHFYLHNGDFIFDYELDSYTKNIDGTNIFIISSCFSGSFIFELNADDNIVLTSSKIDEFGSLGWNSHINDGFRGWADGDANSGNQDGFISIEEVHRYAEDRSSSGRHPQLGDAGNIASITFLQNLKLTTSAGKGYSGMPDDTISFYGWAVGGKPGYSFDWEFGDGSTGSGTNPTHKYDSKGIYTARLTVTDSNGETCSDTVEVVISYVSDLECEGSLRFEDAGPGTTKQGSFIVRNIGDPGSSLNWEVSYVPIYFIILCDPDEGYNLKPEDGDFIVNVTVIIPEGGEYNTFIHVSNKDNPEDIEKISIYVETGMAANLCCIGSISQNNLKPGEKINVSFNIKNIGSSETCLDWKITDYPEWGEWSFNPEEGYCLKPEDGEFTVEVEIQIPNEKNKDLSGKITVVNMNNPDDEETVKISISTPKNMNFIDYFLPKIIEKFTFIRNFFIFYFESLQR
jgi:PKD repeat protein